MREDRIQAEEEFNEVCRELEKKKIDQHDFKSKKNILEYAYSSVASSHENKMKYIKAWKSLIKYDDKNTVEKNVYLITEIMNCLLEKKCYDDFFDYLKILDETLVQLNYDLTGNFFDEKIFRTQVAHFEYFVKKNENEISGENISLYFSVISNFLAIDFFFDREKILSNQKSYFEKVLFLTREIYEKHENNQNAFQYLYMIYFVVSNNDEFSEEDVEYLENAKKISEVYKDDITLSILYAYTLYSLVFKVKIKDDKKYNNMKKTAIEKGKVIFEILLGNRVRHEYIIFMWEIFFGKKFFDNDLIEKLEMINEICLDKFIKYTENDCDSKIYCLLCRYIINEKTFTEDNSRLLSLLETTFMKLFTSKNNKKNGEIDKIFEIKNVEARRYVILLYMISCGVVDKQLVRDFDRSSFAHYSKIESIKYLIKPNRKSETCITCGKCENQSPILRLRNAAYMNDSEEGSIILDMIFENCSCKSNDFKYLSRNEFSSQSSVYLFSLTKAVNKLEMWAQYGQLGEGVCLEFDSEYFDQEESHTFTFFELCKKRNPSELNKEEELSKISNISKCNLYEVIYLKKNQDNINITNIIDILNKINEIELSNRDANCVNHVLKHSIDMLRFLFKSADYEYEKEFRIIIYSELDSDLIKLDSCSEQVPQLYIEIQKPLKYKKIILGPKIKNPHLMIPYINYCDKDIEVEMSKIKFR